MLKTTSNGLLVLAFALAGGTHSASAQYPSGYAQPPIQGQPVYGTSAPQDGQYAPLPQGGQYGPAPQGAHYAPAPQGGQYAPAPQGGQYAPAPQSGQYVPAPTYSGEQFHQGEIPPDAVVQGAEGGQVPYSEDFGSGPQGLGYPGVISNGGGDQLYPYDQQDPWLHGYWQEIPAYGGYAHYRPYNYKHVLAQTQAAAGWGLDARMPYSQQFWHRYEQRASLEHCPLPAHALDNPNAELDPAVEAERIRRELRDGERRLKTLERKGF